MPNSYGYSITKVITANNYKNNANATVANGVKHIDTSVESYCGNTETAIIQPRVN